MKRKIIKNLMLMLTLTVLCLAVGLSAAAEERTFVGSGECGAQGDNVIWTLYDDGELVISGEGEMADYDLMNTPSFGSEFETVRIENGVTSIGSFSFRESSVKIAEIAASVQNIGDSAFSVCESLSYINIPDGIVTIGNGTFYSCSALKSIELPDSIVTIGSGAFQGCSNLESVTLPDGLTSIGRSTFAHCEKLTDINLPDKLTTIGEDAFYYCDSLTSIILPDSVETIGKDTFQFCQKLSYVYIGSGVKTIEGVENFSYCPNLEKIVVDEENESFSSDEHGVLFNKDKTVLITYPEGNKAETYSIPYGVTTVSDEAFDENCYIVSVIFPDTVTHIGDGVFYQCISLSDIEIPASVESIGDYCFVTDIFLDKIVINNMDAELGDLFFGFTAIIVSDEISREDFMAIYKEYLLTGDESAYEELLPYIIFADDSGAVFGTIYCHEGSTAQAYAIENGVDYETVHFYENGWIYDYENMIRHRECRFCDYAETENLETVTEGDVEIVKPADPDTDFVVDAVTDYVVIEETLENGVDADWEIIKAFDINLKNKDGVHVQPDGSVKVKLPNDWSKDGVYKVYRVNDDGTLTDMEAYREGSHLVFDTDHFSIYVIVVENEKSENPTEPEPDTPEAPEAPEAPEKEIKNDLFYMILDIIKAVIDFLFSWING